MKFQDPITGEFKDLHIKASDTLPTGTVVDYEGTEVPEGWEQIDEFIPELIKNALYYKDGDTFSSGTFFLGGLFTSSSKKIATTIFLPKSLKNINSITFNSFTGMAVRKDNGGYLLNIGGSAYEGTIKATKISDNAVALEFTSTNVLDGTNNTPVGIELWGVNLTFNE